MQRSNWWVGEKRSNDKNDKIGRDEGDWYNLSESLGFDAERETKEEQVAGFTLTGKSINKSIDHTCLVLHGPREMLFLPIYIYIYRRML